MCFTCTIRVRNRVNESTIIIKPRYDGKFWALRMHVVLLEGSKQRLPSSKVFHYLGQALFFFGKARSILLCLGLQFSISHETLLVVVVVIVVIVVIVAAAAVAAFALHQRHWVK